MVDCVGGSAGISTCHEMPMEIATPVRASALGAVLQKKQGGLEAGILCSDLLLLAFVFGGGK